MGELRGMFHCILHLGNHAGITNTIDIADITQLIYTVELNRTKMIGHYKIFLNYSDAPP